MIALSDNIYLTPEQYLELEEKSPFKHEYIDGQIYAMVGVTDKHNSICFNIALLIKNHLRGSDCRLYGMEMKTRIEEKNRFYYPDIFVTCDPRDRDNRKYKCFPKLIIEVLSDSTEAFDRGDKFIDYRTLDSLQEYVLVNYKHRLIEIYRRDNDNTWNLQSYNDKTFELKSIDLTASLDEVYEDVEI